VIGGIVRIEALRAFTALIELMIPELAGKTCAGQAPSGEDEEIPNLSIEPGRWRFVPEQSSIHATLPGNVAVYEVGNHEVPCVVSIVAGSVGERALLEAKVLDLFYSGRHPLTGLAMPGVIVLQVSSCPDLSHWSCSFDLDSDEWNEQHALDRRYESRIIVDVTIPALTVRRPVYTIEQLVLGVQQLPPATAVAVPPVELVTIDINGHIEPFTP
jgi:hypothetical protein